MLTRPAQWLNTTLGMAEPGGGSEPSPPSLNQYFYNLPMGSENQLILDL